MKFTCANNTLFGFLPEKKVNELMEELFETVVDEMGLPRVEDNSPEEKEHVVKPQPNVNTPQVLRFEEPLANVLNEQHRTVKELLEQLKMKKSSAKQQQEVERVKPKSEKVLQTLVLDLAQRKRLQQQMQQHVQLLTQVHLLASFNPNLSSEASTTRAFLKELGTFAQSSITLHHQFNPKFQTFMFQPCNLVGAVQLIEDFSAHVSIDGSPCKMAKKSAYEFPCLPKQVAWILATSKVFMYPELLPLCSLQAKDPEDKIFFTKAEDNLLALGLKHFECTEFPKPLISKYLLTCKTAHQLTVRIKNLTLSRAPDNIVKLYRKTKELPVLIKCCEEIQPHQWKAPIEMEEHLLPFWLKASLPSIQKKLRYIAEKIGNVPGTPETNSEPGLDKGSSELGREARYPLLLPEGVVLKLKPVAKRFYPKAWRQKQKRSSELKPLLIRPNPSLQSAFNSWKIPAKSIQSEISHPIQTVPSVPTLEVTGGHSSESSLALPEVRTCFPLSAVVHKVTLPSLAPSKFQEPCVKQRPKREGTKASHALKTAPFIHPAPVIFTVPATTVKVVSLSTGCNVIQPVNAAVAQSSQTIPIATLLVNPTSFSCPLNQPLLASSFPPLIVSGNSVNLHVPSTPEAKTQGNLDIACPSAEGNEAFQGLEPKLEPQELPPLCTTVFPQKEHSPGPQANRGDQEELPENCTYRWTIVKTERGGLALEALPQGFQESLDSHSGNLEEIVKVEPEEPGEETSSESPDQNICGVIKEEPSMEMAFCLPSVDLTHYPPLGRSFTQKLTTHSILTELGTSSVQS
ncbi:YY1-associated protein 1 [Rhynchocyon petersi]